MRLSKVPDQLKVIFPENMVPFLMFLNPLVSLYTITQVYNILHN